MTDKIKNKTITDRLLQYANELEMDAPFPEQLSKTIESLKRYIKELIPKNYSFPYLWFNKVINHDNIKCVECRRCSKLIYKNDWHFNMQHYPQGDGHTTEERYERFCLGCIKPEEMEQPNYNEYAKSVKVDRMPYELVYECVKQNGGITKEKLRGKCGLGRAICYDAIDRLLQDGKISKVNGPKRSHMFYVNEKMRLNLN